MKDFLENALELRADDIKKANNDVINNIQQLYITKVEEIKNNSKDLIDKQINKIYE